MFEHFYSLHSFPKDFVLVYERVHTSLSFTQKNKSRLAAALRCEVRVWLRRVRTAVCCVRVLTDDTGRAVGRGRAGPRVTRSPMRHGVSQGPS